VTQAACQTPAPGTPSNLSPPNGATVTTNSATLSWSATTDTQSYNVYFGSSSNPPFEVNTTDTSYSPTGLIADTTYYWRVEALNSCGRGTKGPIWSFTTTTPLSLDITYINCTSDSQGGTSFDIAGTACGPEGAELAGGPCCPGQTGFNVYSCSDWHLNPSYNVCLRLKGDPPCTDWTGGGQNGPPPITACMGVWYPGTTPATCISDTVIIGDCPEVTINTPRSGGDSHSIDKPVQQWRRSGPAMRGF